MRGSCSSNTILEQPRECVTTHAGTFVVADLAKMVRPSRYNERVLLFVVDQYERALWEHMRTQDTMTLYKGFLNDLPAWLRDFRLTDRYGMQGWLAAVSAREKTRRCSRLRIRIDNHYTKICYGNFAYLCLWHFSWTSLHTAPFTATTIP